MTQIDAVYRGGVFQPLEAVHLNEEQRVRLSIVAGESSMTEEWFRKLRERHVEFIKQHGPLPDSAPDIAADRLR